VEKLLSDTGNTGDVFLYLPTKRGNGIENPLLDVESNLEEFDAALRETNSELLIKRHPEEETPSIADSCSNVTVLESSIDSQVLLPHADVLLTDYSSVYLPFLLLDRPIVFFPFDFEEFTATRPLLFDYEAITPGPIVHDYDSLEDVLLHQDLKAQYQSTREEIRDKYHRYQDGNASRRLTSAFRTSDYTDYIVY
jgi:CDP-glycerol glycerophosphotransferase (TagB/SpsB family)